jgi:hypothetical protein
MIRGSLGALVASFVVSLAVACGSGSSSQPGGAPPGTDAGGLPTFDASTDGWVVSPADDAGTDGTSGLAACTWDDTNWDQCLWQ